MVHSIFGASGALPRPAERMGEFQPAGETNATSPASAANHSGGCGPTNLSTVSAEDKPYAVAIWRRWDGEFIRITSDPNNRKHKNILANPNVSVLALDPQRQQIARLLPQRGKNRLIDRANFHALRGQPCGGGLRIRLAENHFAAAAQQSRQQAPWI